MPHSIEYDDKLKFLKLTVTGELNLETLRNMANSVSKMAGKTGCMKILSDLRNANPSEKVFEIYKMPISATESGITKSIKRALVVGNKSEEFRFLETVFVNQGHQAKMFKIVDDAIGWLVSG